MLESMNAIVAERVRFVDEYIRSNQLSKECRKHIFPIYTPDPKYEPLQLVKLSGTFLFLFILLCVSLCVLLIEILSTRWTHDVQMEFRDLHIRYDSRLSLDTRMIITKRYAKILAAIESDLNKS